MPSGHPHRAAGGRAVIVATALVVVGVAVLAVAVALLARSRSVTRVAVPARLLSSRWNYWRGTSYDVEYPGPGGRAWYGTVRMSNVVAPGVRPGFSGQVWVDPNNPSDVTARRWGAHGDLALALMIAGVPVLAGGTIMLLIS